MRVTGLTRAAGIAAGALLASSVLVPQALAGGEAGELRLRDLGFMIVGADTEAQPDGTLNVMNQMFVTYMLPSEKTHQFPLVLVHGGGGQASDWMGTPDGRDGWADYFVAAGFDVYLVDRPGYGRSPTNPSCGELGGPANTGFISQLAQSDPTLWPGGEPTPTNEAVIGWAATSPAGPYCGDEIAARDIALLLEQIGPAILVAHSAGGGSTFPAADAASDKVAGIIAFEAAGSNPVGTGFGNIAGQLTWEPALPAGFMPADDNGCQTQGGDAPSQLPNWTFPVVLVGSAGPFGVEAGMQCSVSAWQQAGVDASYVYLPSAGHPGGGHFSMAQLDSADIAQTFIDIATDIEMRTSTAAP